MFTSNASLNPSLAQLAFVVVLASVTSLPSMPSAAATSAVAPAALVATPPATIGSLTMLSRQLREANLRKELREANKANNDSAAPARAGPALSDAIAFAPLPKTMVAIKAQAQGQGMAAPVAREPRVQSVTGMGNRLVATLESGDRLAVGDKLDSGGVSWTALSISKDGVQFKRCESSLCSPVRVGVIGSTF